MAVAGLWVWLSRHGEAILLALVAHELAAGAAFTVAGLPGVGAFLWAVGAGLALADMLVQLALRTWERRWSRQLLLTTVVLVAATAAAASGVYGVGNLLGTLGVLAVMFPPHRWARHRPSADSAHHPDDWRHVVVPARRSR